MADTDERAAVAAERAARAGARVANDRFRSDIDVETKGEDDVVTEADRAAQRTVIESIRETFPDDDAIVGEEEDERKTVPETGAAWVIDPIDGTSNYVRDIRVWGPRSRPSSTANRSPRPPSRPRWATCTPPTRTARTATESRCASVTCLIHGGPRWTRRCGGTSTPVTSTPPPARRSFGDSATCAGSAPHRSCCRRSPRADWRGPSRTCGRTRGTPSPACSWFGRPGKATDIEGNRWRHDSTGLVVSNGNLHDEVLDAARAIEGLD